MRSEQGSSASSGQFTSTPLSICVLQISPWTISLNMPSPPTHTTLSRGQRETLAKAQNKNRTTNLKRTHQTSSAPPPSSGGPWRDWRSPSLSRQRSYGCTISDKPSYQERPGNRWCIIYRQRPWIFPPGGRVEPPSARRHVCPGACLRTDWCRPAGVWVCWLHTTTTTTFLPVSCDNMLVGVCGREVVPSAASCSLMLLIQRWHRVASEQVKVTSAHRQRCCPPLSTYITANTSHTLMISYVTPKITNSLIRHVWTVDIWADGKLSLWRATVVSWIAYDCTKCWVCSMCSHS